MDVRGVLNEDGKQLWLLDSIDTWCTLGLNAIGKSKYMFLKRFRLCRLTSNVKLVFCMNLTNPICHM